MLDISAGGISLQTDQKPEKGTAVIVYVKDIGRLEGMVARHHARGFAVVFDMNQVNRDRLIDKLTIKINPGAEETETRAHLRVAIEETAHLVLEDGRKLKCRVLDMSFGGVSLAVEVFPRVGELVMIGRMRGRVVRHHDRGIGVAFDELHANWGSLTQSMKTQDG